MLSVFYIFCFLTAISAFLILFTKNILYAAFLFLLSLLGIAAIYIFLSADFLAITQVLIYIGGVLVLILFGIMFTYPPIPTLKQATELKNLGNYQPQSGIKNILAGVLIGTGLFICLFNLIRQSQFDNQGWIRQAVSNSKTVKYSQVENLGIRLVLDHVVSLELIAVILLISLIGVALISAMQRVD